MGFNPSLRQKPYGASFRISIASPSPSPSPSLNLPLFRSLDLNPLSRSPSLSIPRSPSLSIPRSPSPLISLSFNLPLPISTLSLDLPPSLPLSISLSFCVTGVEPLAQLVNAPAAADQGQAATPAVVIALGLVVICLQLPGRRIVVVEFCNGINDLNNVIFLEVRGSFAKELGSQIRSRGSPGMSSGRQLGSSFATRILNVDEKVTKA